MPGWVGCTFSYVVETTGFPPGAMYIDMYYSLEMLRGFPHRCFVFIFHIIDIVLFAHDYITWCAKFFLFQKISDR